jgi:hypothetical protein
LGEPGIKIILEALPLLPGFEDRDQPVTLQIKGESLFLKAKGSAEDWTEISIPAQVAGLPVSISMNRTYLAKALKFGFAQIDIENRSSPMVFSAKGKTMIVSPLGPPDAKKVPVAPAPPPTSPPENASAAATPPPAEPTTTAESPERTSPMPENTMAAPQRGNLNSHNGHI